MVIRCIPGDGFFPDAVHPVVNAQSNLQLHVKLFKNNKHISLKQITTYMHITLNMKGLQILTFNKKNIYYNTNKKLFTMIFFCTYAFLLHTSSHTFPWIPLSILHVLLFFCLIHMKFYRNYIFCHWVWIRTCFFELSLYTSKCDCMKTYPLPMRQK